MCVVLYYLVLKNDPEHKGFALGIQVIVSKRKIIARIFNINKKTLYLIYLEFSSFLCGYFTDTLHEI